MNRDVVVLAAKRTPIGSFLGALAPLSAAALGAAAIRAVLETTGTEPAEVDEVLMGCVLPAGIGQAPARQAALRAGLPASVPCTTVNKMCGSGMKAVMLGVDLIRAGSAEVVIAGGMESMSNAPYLLPRARQGLRMGHGETLDHMLYDGLQDPESGALMGAFAEQLAERWGLSREAQDEFAAESVRRALAAMQGGDFAQEIIPVEVTGRSGTLTVHEDEQPRRCDLARIPHLPPVFRKQGGTVTAANSSSISDGAAALLLASGERAEGLGRRPLVRIAGHATHARRPAEFTTAPIGAIERLFRGIRWRDSEVDLYEINEAFAVVTLAAMHALELDPACVNVNGGACALGHPIGASGARILVTLLHALGARELRRGIAALCIGGGEATAVAVERL